MFDASTEVLTRRGWLGYQKINFEDEILTFKEGNYEWKHLDSLYIKDTEKPLLYLQSKELDALVTSEHSWLVEDLATGKRHYKETCKLDGGDLLILGADADLSGIDIVTDDFSYQLGACIAMGNKSRLRELHVSSGDERFYSPFDMFKYELNYNNEPSYSVLNWSYSLRRELFDGLIDGNGGMLNFTTASKPFYLWLLALTVSLGYRADITVENPDKYSIIFKTKNTIRHNYNKISVTELQISTKKYNGVLWCPGTGNHSIVIKRNAKNYLSGQ